MWTKDCYVTLSDCSAAKLIVGTSATSSAIELSYLFTKYGTGGGSPYVQTTATVAANSAYGAVIDLTNSAFSGNWGIARVRTTNNIAFQVFAQLEEEKVIQPCSGRPMSGTTFRLPYIANAAGQRIKAMVYNDSGSTGDVVLSNPVVGGWTHTYSDLAAGWAFQWDSNGETGQDFSVAGVVNIVSDVSIIVGVTVQRSASYYYHYFLLPV